MFVRDFMPPSAVLHCEALRQSWWTTGRGMGWVYAEKVCCGRKPHDILVSKFIVGYYWRDHRPKKKFGSTGFFHMKAYSNFMIQQDRHVVKIVVYRYNSERSSAACFPGARALFLYNLVFWVFNFKNSITTGRIIRDFGIQYCKNYGNPFPVRVKKVMFSYCHHLKSSIMEKREQKVQNSESAGYMFCTK